MRVFRVVDKNANGCPFCGSEGHGTINNKTQDAPVIDQQTTDLLKQAKNVKVSDMPMMLTILEAMSPACELAIV